jgi:hypothetical protein
MPGASIDEDSYLSRLKENISAVPDPLYGRAIHGVSKAEPIKLIAESMFCFRSDSSRGLHSSPDNVGRRFWGSQPYIRAFESSGCHGAAFQY